MHRSLVDALATNARVGADRVAAHQIRGGRPVAVTWGELKHQTDEISRGLLRCGLGPGDRVCLWADTSLQWVQCDLGVAGAGGVTVPIYPASAIEDVEAVLCDSGARILMVEDHRDYQRFRRASIKGIDKVVWVGHPDEAPEGALPLSSLVEQGRPTEGDVLAEAQRPLDRDSVFSLIYTSGTTGVPKGVVMTHGAMLHVAEAVERIDLVRPSDCQFIFLPLAHAFARALMVSWLVTRHRAVFPESRQSVERDLRQAGATILCGVPLFFERIMDRVAFAAGRRFPWLGEFTAQCIDWMSGEKPVQKGITMKTVGPWIGRAIHGALGGEVRLLISGGARLDPKLAHFFENCGLELLEGYGLTESGAASFVNRPGRNEIGTVGFPLPGTAFRIAADGEVLLRSASVTSGYWGGDEGADCPVVDGWLHTGDLGSVRPSGALELRGRKRSILVTSGGRNIAPERLEAALCAEPAIGQACVIGDGRASLAALLVADERWLRDILDEPEVAYATLTQRSEARARVEALIRTANRSFAPYSRIRRFALVGQPFSTESGELTPTGKVRREQVLRRYARLITDMYELPASV